MDGGDVVVEDGGGAGREDGQMRDVLLDLAEEVPHEEDLVRSGTGGLDL